MMTRKRKRRNRRIATDELRTLRLERIRKRIDSGLYDITPAQLAEKLLDEGVVEDRQSTPIDPPEENTESISTQPLKESDDEDR